MRRCFFLCAPLLMAAMTTAVSAQTLRDQAPEIAAKYGTVMIAPDGARYVIYGPLNRLWLVGEDGTVLDHAIIDVHQTPFEHVQLHWNGGYKDIFNLSAGLGMTFTTDPIPLVAHYDRLLTEPLARPVSPLPTGAYFNASGHVFDGAGAQIGDWDSHGATVALRLGTTKEPHAELTDLAETDPDTPRPDAIRIAVADLVAAMDPEAK